jgi:acyl-CoA synthetase (NDP forming)
MIRQIQGYPLLEGIRGQAPKDTAALREMLLKVSRLAVENPEIREMDLNPVIVHETGATLVDARIMIGCTLKPDIDG